MLDILVILLVVLNFRLLGSSRLAACIQTVAAQAILLAAITLGLHASNIEWQLVLIVAASVAIKGGLLPWLLRRAVREAGAPKEIEPLVGFNISLLLGVALLGACMLTGSQLRVPGGQTNGLLIPAALFTAVTGLFLIVARKKAVTQVLGYLGMENGINAFGMAFAIREPLLVAMAVLLDVLVAALVMGIAIYHISREFDHIDTTMLCRVAERCVIGDGSRVDVCTAGDEQLDHVHMLPSKRLIERSRAFTVTRIDVGSVSQKQLHHT